MGDTTSLKTGPLLCGFNILAKALKLNDVDHKSYALSVRDFIEVTREVTIKHYRIHRSPDIGVFIARRAPFTNLLLLVEHYQGIALTH